MVLSLPHLPRRAALRLLLRSRTDVLRVPRAGGAHQLPQRRARNRPLVPGLPRGLPLAFRLARLPRCDVVLSSSSAFAKGIRRHPAQSTSATATPPCASPGAGRLSRERPRPQRACPRSPKACDGPAALVGHPRNANVDVFVANSQNVARRILRLYGRRAQVVWPPVGVERFAPTGHDPRTSTWSSPASPGTSASTWRSRPARTPRSASDRCGDGPERSSLRTSPDRRSSSSAPWAGRPFPS